ncbi:MAG: hydrolase [Bacteroidetes bacterium]|jgi:cell wall-associated NlpC family hydrolase|nr:hydrolase [Bacteroidota bacterium]
MRKLLSIFLVCFSLACASQKDPKVPADSIIAFAKKFVGTKYTYANCEPNKGFDCSGFVYYVFNHFGIKVPRSSIDYTKFGRKISLDSCKKGDVIVFTGTKPKNRRPGHVGIILSEQGEDVQFIHSSSGKKHKGVVISNYSESPYYKSRFIKVVRLEEVK